MERSYDFSALLQNHEKKHKLRPTQFASVASGVRKRLENNIKSRKSNRLTIFDRIRDLPTYNTPKKQLSLQTKLEHRRMQLEKWKEEKEKKKKQAAAQKKKPFVTGIAHAPLKYVPPPPLPKSMPSTSGRVTRSQSAKNNINPKPVMATSKASKSQYSFAPQNASFKPPEMKNMVQLPTLEVQAKNKKNNIKFEPVKPNESKVNTKVAKSKTQPQAKEIINNIRSKNIVKVETRVTRCSARLSKVSSFSSNDKQSSSKDALSVIPEKTPVKNQIPQKSIQTSKISTPKNPIPKSESSSEERLRSPKSPVDVPMTPEQIVEQAMKCSPCVTHSRGKDNARKEMKKKLEEGLLDEDLSNLDSVEHFRRQLNSEIKRMTEMCDIWEKISEEIVLPEAGQEAVLGAVGQARLLMSHKLQQFASLLARCECPEPGHALVTPADLHGFWDMVFMQVENVDMRFKKLEEMRSRNWVEVARPARRTRPAPRAPAPTSAAPAAPAASSRLRDMIAAARKAKKEDFQSQEAQQSANPVESQTETNKTFEAGFFCVRSPVRTSAPATPSNRHSLLKAVLSSEAKKSASKNTISLAMLRASSIGKNVDNNSVSSEARVVLTPLNMHATPGRSILKSLNKASTRKSGKKSIKVVLFNEDADDNNMFGNETVGNFDICETSAHVGKENKTQEDSTRRSLVRQNAVEERSPVLTRSRRKSALAVGALTPGLEQSQFRAEEEATN